MKVQWKEGDMEVGVIAGILRAETDYIICIDSDGQCMPDSFLELC